MKRILAFARRTPLSLAAFFSFAAGMLPTSIAYVMALFTLAGFAPGGAVHAQGLTVVSSSPKDSASGVALETEVRFTFSSALDTCAVGEDGLPIAVSAAPRDSLSIDGFSLDEDGSSLSIDVLQTPTSTTHGS